MDGFTAPPVPPHPPALRDNTSGNGCSPECMKLPANGRHPSDIGFQAALPAERHPAKQSGYDP
jgi:hypothetical protein